MRLFIPVAAVLMVVALSAGPVSAQDGRKPAAQYLVSVSTDNLAVPGMPAGEGGLGGMIASLVTGGVGGGAQRTLWLDLLGPETPAEPKAEHQIPPGLKMGGSLPLLTPAPVRSERVESQPAEEHERQDTRILFYWGCGEAIGPGQPKVLDTAKMSTADFSQIPVARQGSSVVRLSPRQGWTYGEWPNRETRVQVPGDGSLQGEHLIKGNYAPEINFSLNERQDFMAPVVFTRTEGSLADAMRLEWRSVPNATGYFMMATGGSGDAREVVMWNSSERQEMGGGLMNYVAPGTVQKYVKEKVVLPPDATTCTIPKGIFKSAEGAMLMFIAYGPEANFAQPPKPADPKAPWNPVWTAKVRFKSSGMLPLGMETSDAGAAPGEDKPTSGQKAEGETQPEGGAPSPMKDVMDGAKKLKGIFGF